MGGSRTVANVVAKKVFLTFGNNKGSLFLVNNFLDFYEKYPYDGPAGLVSKVDSNGIIDFEMHFFYNRIQKAANSYTCFLLSKLKYGLNVDYDASRVKSDFWLKPSYLSQKQLKRFDQLFKFTFVRNLY